MKDSQAREIRLKDYQLPCYLVDSTRLHFTLDEDSTLVKSTLQLRLNPDWPAHQPRPLILDGVKLELKSLSIDGRALKPEDYQVETERLIIEQVPPNFELECVTLIRPRLNTELEGLYQSKGMFCTQCEAEGFRKITYYPDRPDVMSVFTTTLVADQKKYPVLLANGNDIDRGAMDDGRHWVTWHDPFKKPAYLFALVAGSLVHIEDSFTTQSGRVICLQIFVEAENIDKCEHAMRSLKHAMAWDEEVYGREYDLDKFMIVAVNDFNMGAMENKGLNIFNSACILAKPETATDADYQRIEGVVAHEYFHNWSGNRVTCRDWFQLSLKEGFTVFRDQQFSADMGSARVKRIDDVSLLRTAQFAEDAGPLAHPVQPQSYLEISNFYTVTIYEKGAELVRMLHTLLGPEQFRTGSDLYFERHDGQAVTIEDFVSAMQDASSVDLQQFMHWYRQAGTPRLDVSDEFDAQQGLYRLRVRQNPPRLATKTDPQPLHIPLAIGLLDGAGQELACELLELVKPEQVFEFPGYQEKPLPSLLRGFSAPVKLHYPYTREQLLFLMRHDGDGFNRWDAGQKLALSIVQDNIEAFNAGEEMRCDERLLEILRALLQDAELDRAMLARMLTMPSEAYIAEQQQSIEVAAIHAARRHLRLCVARSLQSELRAAYQANQSQEAYQPNAQQIARRSLKNVCLSYLMLLEDAPLGQEALELCLAQFKTATNMTDRSAALAALVHSGFYTEREAALMDFYTQWQQDALVLDRWFSIQASSPQPDSFERVQQLLQHPAFTLTNPNKVRALIGVFANQNPANFHRTDGAGYRLLAERILQLDAINPQIAARLAGPLVRWHRYAAPYAEPMKAELLRIREQKALSKDLFEVVSKALQ